MFKGAHRAHLPFRPAGTLASPPLLGTTKSKEKLSPPRNVDSVTDSNMRRVVQEMSMIRRPEIVRAPRPTDRSASTDPPIGHDPEGDRAICMQWPKPQCKRTSICISVREESFNNCKDILHAGEGIMRGVTKASLRQKTTNNIPTYVVMKGAFLTQFDRNITVYQYKVSQPDVTK